jgi:hypothetical protein
MKQVHLVKTNGLILACYHGDLLNIAEAHARTITGAHVQTVDVLTGMTSAASSDAGSDDWDDDDTPVQEIPPK